MPGISGADLFSGQGIDVTATVSAFVQAARVPEQLWQTQQQNLTLQNNVLNTLNSNLSSLLTDINALNDPLGAFSARTVTSSQSSIVSGAVTNSAAIGNHVITVNNLATTGSYYSGSVADANTALGSGSFDLQVGNGSAVTINVGSSDTLTTLAASINQQNLGVTANVVTDSTGARLTLVSNASGSAGDITISNATGMSGLAFTKGTTGQDASLTVDGVPVTSSTNTVTGVVNGLTINLNGITAAGQQVQLSVGADTSQMSQAINNFVKDYNTIIAAINQQFAVDPTSRSTGPLGADPTLRQVQQQLLGDMSQVVSSGTGISTLSDLGITMNNDGSLSVNSATLNSALQNNLAGVQTFFQGNGTVTGFAQTMASQLNTLTDPTEGAFYVELTGNKQTSQDLQNQINDFEVYIGNLQTQLTAQYNQLNAELQSIPSQKAYMNALFGNNTSGSSNG
jgi:flagellar hook-associated protein 2